jgi:hypothetical protein
MKTTRTKWRLRGRNGHEKITSLHLYPELDCSSCVDECDGDGQEQLQYYCDYIKRRYSQWWEADAVPILWTIVEDQGEHSGFCCESIDRMITFYPVVTNLKTGEPINWYQLPVGNERFPEFARALVWLPAPFQPHAPLRSIVRGVLPRHADLDHIG